MVVYGSQALIYILFMIKVFCTHSSIQVLVSHSLALVGEALTGFLPAAGGAPLVLALHSVHFAAFLGLPAALPAHAKRHGDAIREEVRGKKINKSSNKKKRGRTVPHLKEQWVREGDALIGCSLFCWSHCSPTLTERHRGFATWREKQKKPTKQTKKKMWVRYHQTSNSCVLKMIT